MFVRKISHENLQNVIYERTLYMKVNDCSANACPEAESLLESRKLLHVARLFESTGEEPAALVEAKEVITKYARANPLGMWHHLRGVNEDADSVVSVNLVGRWDHMDPDGYWMNGTKKRAERGW